MPFTLDKNLGTPLQAFDNGDGTCTLIVASYGDVMLSSIAVFEQAKLTGDVTLSASGSIVLRELGNNIVVYAPSAGVPTYATPTFAVGETSPAAGTILDVSGTTGGIGFPVMNTAQRNAITPANSGVVIYNNDDACLEQWINGVWTSLAPGYTGLAVSGQSYLTGNVNLVASGAVVLSESGQNITVYAPSVTNTSVAVSGSSPLTGAVTFSASGGALLAQSGNNITVYAPTGSALPSDIAYVDVNNIFSAYQTLAAAGVASHGALAVTGAPYTAGNATTNKPLVLIENATVSTGWSTNGTYLGVNAPTAFSGKLVDLQANGTSEFSVDVNGALTLGNVAPAVDVPGITIKAAAGNSAAIYQYSNGGGGPSIFQTGNNGYLTIQNNSKNVLTTDGGGHIGLASGAANGAANLDTIIVVNQPSDTTHRTLSVAAIASQTANLFTAYSSNGTSIVMAVAVDGKLTSASGNESTGSGSALLGTNCPASTATAPYTWIAMKSSDGSTVYVPAWK